MTGPISCRWAISCASCREPARRWVSEIDPSYFAGRLKAARRHITEEYSPGRESGDIVGVWSEILRIAHRKSGRRPPPRRLDADPMPILFPLQMPVAAVG